MLLQTSDLRKGDIVLVHENGFVSDAIQLVTHSPFNHVAIVDDTGSDVLLEANGFRTVGYQDLSAYRGKCLVMRLDGLTDEQASAIVKFVTDRFGTHYDYKAIVAEFLRYEFHVQPHPEDQHRYICSTLVAAAYASVDIHLTDCVLASPDDIYRSGVLTFVGLI